MVDLKRRLGFALLFILLFAVAGVAYASAPITLLVNGKTITTDVAPQIINGRVMVPIRAVAEALDADVAWNPATNTVSITKEMPPKLLRLNGEQTTWPYWYEDNKLYMERRNCIELLRTRYASPWYSVSILGDTLSINNRSYYIPDIKKKDEFVLIPLDEIAFQGILKFDWDPETGNLSIIKD